jgi:hypothetical protein
VSCLSFLPECLRDVLLPLQHPGGYSRFLVHRDLRESMTEADIEIILICAGVAVGQASEHFTIRIVDQEASRGVPLVELKTDCRLRFSFLLI